MASAADLLAGELAVVSAAILGTVGFVWKSITTKLAQLNAHMIRSEQQDRDVDRDLAELRRQVPQLSQNLAVLASEVESHLRWHERHPI